MEEDLNFLGNGRRPCFFSKWKTTSIFFENGRQPQFFISKIIMQTETFKIKAMVVAQLRVTLSEYKHRLFSDTAISGSMEDLMNDLLAWSNFQERYPNFAKSKEVNNQVEYLKSSLFNGTNNTPAFDYNTYVAKKEFRDIWNTTLETYPNAPFAKELYAHMQKLESNNWKFPK